MSRFADAEGEDDGPLDGEEERDEREEDEEDESGEGAADFGEWESEGSGGEGSGGVVSLFEPSVVMGSVEEALSFDGGLGFDVKAFKSLGAVFDRIRVVNYIRKMVACQTGPWSGQENQTREQLLAEVRNSSGLPDEARWASEEYLTPVIFEDLYLTWADDDHFDEDGPHAHALEEKFMMGVDDDAIVKEMSHLREDLLTNNHVDLTDLK